MDAGRRDDVPGVRTNVDSISYLCVSDAPTRMVEVEVPSSTISPRLCGQCRNGQEPKSSRRGLSCWAINVYDTQLRRPGPKADVGSWVSPPVLPDRLKIRGRVL